MLVATLLVFSLGDKRFDLLFWPFRTPVDGLIATSPYINLKLQITMISVTVEGESCKAKILLNKISAMPKTDNMVD